METTEKIQQLLSCIKEQNPLIHHITNYVTVNDCANIVLALGGSPVMADAIEEVEAMVSIASALVINIGTLNSEVVKSMIKAGKKANELGIPVILDPVGVGATPYRREVAEELIGEIKFSVIRGNLAEIMVLCGLESISKGVDSNENSSQGLTVAKNAAKLLNTVVAITGAVDYISDGEKVICLENGDKILTKVIGTGCMSTSLIGCYCAVTKDYLTAAAAGILSMGISGEIALKHIMRGEGSGSFKVHLLDAIYNLSKEDIKGMSMLYEK